ADPVPVEAAKPLSRKSPSNLVISQVRKQEVTCCLVVSERRGGDRVHLPDLEITTDLEIN
ncbi:MAG: hypothetical protein ACR2G5_08975, partial [Pyrinomonadaceae bacterium]